MICCDMCGDKNTEPFRVGIVGDFDPRRSNEYKELATFPMHLCKDHQIAIVKKLDAFIADLTIQLVPKQRDGIRRTDGKII